MAIPDTDQERVLKLLLQDVEATIGGGYQDIVLEAATRIGEFAADPAQYLDSVVEDVQQYIHDCFIDTTWPECPRHPNHPLWLRGEQWCCERDGVPIAALGELKPQT